MFRSSVPLLWRLKKSKYRLVGTHCSSCNSIYFPPKTFCPQCRRSGKIKEIFLSGKGKIVSFTVIRVAPKGFEDKVPYVIGIIELEEGTLISGEIVGNIEDIKIGKSVHSVFRRIMEDGPDGLIHYGFKFELDD
jgi:uncharacterized OB-fold protein